VKFGVSYNTGYYGLDPDSMAAVARHAADCGFESFYVPEHIVLYPGAKAGAVEFPPSLAVADPLECLTFVAASTGRILLGTGVLLLPYMRAAAADAGRDPDALEYTRWGPIAMSAADARTHASNGITRLVVSPAAADLRGQRDEISAFADRLGLR
jgi:Luciferase-like monooxygenase